MSHVNVLQYGRPIALCSQLLLLAMTGVLFAMLFSPPDQEMALLLPLALFAGLQMLPVVVLVVGLLRKAAWAPWFGMASAVGVLGLHIMTQGLSDNWLVITQAILWLVTGGGLLLELGFSRKRKTSTDAAALQGVCWGCCAAVLPLGIMSTLLAVVFTVGFNTRGGTAPEKDFAARRAWGESTFGSPFLECIDTWAATSEALREDLGDVLRIAPVGGPNRYHPGFTDPGYAEMNLEVIGTRGAGVLHLPEVVIWDTGDIASLGSDATWRFGDQTEYVMKSGKSYLAEYGLATIYADLLALAAREEAEQFSVRWVDLELAVAGSGLQASSRPDRSPRPVEALRDQYREPMLAHLGDALAMLQQSAASASMYRDSATTILERAEDMLAEEERDRLLPQVTEQLRQANRLLKKADKQVPNHEETLELARKRVVLQYLLSYLRMHQGLRTIRSSYAPLTGSWRASNVWN